MGNAPTPFTQERMIALASSAVAKIDRLGPRGVDRVTTEESEAMATLLALSGLIPPARQRVILPRPSKLTNGET